MNKKTRAKSIIFGVITALLFFEIFSFCGGYDYIKAIAFESSPELDSVINGLELTSRGERIFKATNPNLESRENFNANCDSHDIETYVLGCYQTAEDKIHLYNVTQEELDGVRESTAAHELLHAVYNRLPFWEKSSLNKKMKEFYDSLDEKNDIKVSLKLYSEEDFYDELHSRLGTEVKDLPLNLEKHFEAIFKNQDKVVDFYEKYSGTFKKHEDELKEINQKLESLKVEIESEEKRLEAIKNDLNSRIDNYNARVQSGSFSSTTAARKEGENLRNEVNNLNSAYDKLNQKIDEYNTLVQRFNDSLFRTNKIYDSINSNSGINM